MPAVTSTQNDAALDNISSSSKAKNAPQAFVAMLVLAALAMVVEAGDPAQSFDWKVSYAKRSPLGAPQQVIAINGLFPGPELRTTTNNVLSINVHNNIDEPFLLTWNGVQMRHNSWQDGTLGTNCPIPPGKNWTYNFQVKDQIGSFFYFPTTLFQKAAGGFGGITIVNRDIIAVPFPPPEADFTVLIGVWYNLDHKSLRKRLDQGFLLGAPNGVLVNGQGPGGASFLVKPGRTYRFRISNVGIATTLNFRIQHHRMLLVETEGSYVRQTYYDSLDIHVGQSYSVLVAMDQLPRDFYVLASPRFISGIPLGRATLRYTNSAGPPSGPYPPAPDPMDYRFSFNQAQSFRWNLTAGAARPNPQGAYHYGLISITRTILLANSAIVLRGHQRFAVNSRSFIYPDTPLKLADYFGVRQVFIPGAFPDRPDGKPPFLWTSVLSFPLKDNNTEFIFQNNEDTLQTWHLDGYSYFVVGMGSGLWSPASRKSYNMRDAISRSTTQVYPRSWTAVLVELDNQGMWNLRSQNLQQQYLGQELYADVWNRMERSERDEKPIPSNVLLCGRRSATPP